MNASVTLKEGMSFRGTTDSGCSIDLGGNGCSPMEMMLMSLAGCTAMDVISIMRKKRQEVTRFEVKVEGDRIDDHPRVFTDILLTYIVDGIAIDAEALDRSIELSLTRYCPAHAMLSQAVTIRHRTVIGEAV